MGDELSARIKGIERAQYNLQDQLAKLRLETTRAQREILGQLFASQRESQKQFKEIMDFLRMVKNPIENQKSTSLSKEVVHSSDSNPLVIQKRQCSHPETYSPPVIKPQSKNTQRGFLDRSSPFTPKDKRQGDCFKKTLVDPMSVTYANLLPELIRRRLIILIECEPPKFPCPGGHNITCDYHIGSTSHSTENCKALKQKVQELVQAGLLKL